jgi:hypothetical protein
MGSNIRVLMAIEIVIPHVDGCNFHGINAHVCTTRTCAYVRAILYQFNHSAKLAWISVELKNHHK